MATETSPGVIQYIPQIMFAVNLVVAGIVGFVGAWVKLSKCDSTITAHSTALKEISDKLTSLGERIAKLEGGVERDRAAWVQKKSPLSLTSAGEKVLSESHGKAYIDNNKLSLISAIKKENPKTAYDVQELSRKVIVQKSNDDAFSPIKNFAFMRGESLDRVIDVLGIYLRDIALKELGFNLSDIKD